MGRKVHPYGFRVGITKDWQSKWFSEREYAALVLEDMRLRRLVMKLLPDAGISGITIDRNANQLNLTVRTAKPGIVIGRGGQNVEHLRGSLERSTERRVVLGADLDRVEATRGLWAEWSAPCHASSLVGALHAAISEVLTAKQRQVVEAYFFEGASQGEIARRLGVTQQVVQKCLFGAPRGGRLVGGAIARLRSALSAHRPS